MALSVSGVTSIKSAACLASPQSCFAHSECCRAATQGGSGPLGLWRQTAACQRGAVHAAKCGGLPLSGANLPTSAWPPQDGPFRAHYCLRLQLVHRENDAETNLGRNILANRRKATVEWWVSLPNVPLQARSRGSPRGDHNRPPSIEEKEKLLGFSQGHTEPSTSIRYAKQKPQEVCRIRHALLGRSVHCQVLAWAVQAGLRYLRLPLRGCRSGAELLRTMADDVPAGHAPVIEGRELIRQLRRRQHHKGREIRHASPMGTPQASQLGNLNPAWWKWKTAVSTTWQYPEHINILEWECSPSGYAGSSVRRLRLIPQGCTLPTATSPWSHEPRTVRFPSYQ